MEGKELREGNYFKWSAIASMGIGVDIVTKENHYDHLNLKEPVELTEEWLLKFGFDYRTSDIETVWYNYKSKYAFEFYQWVGGYYPDYAEENGQELKHVHQLQNLYFALTGEELAIVSNANN